MYLSILQSHLCRTSISLLVNAHVSSPYSRADLTQASYTLSLVLSPMLQFNNKLTIYHHLLHAAVTHARTALTTLAPQLHSPAHLPSNKTVLLPRLLSSPSSLLSPLLHLLDIQNTAPLGDLSDLNIACDTIYYIQYKAQSLLPPLFHSLHMTIFLTESSP